MTTAAQRVARAGHFVKQWGPDVVPLSSGLAAGDDGRVILTQCLFNYDKLPQYQFQYSIKKGNESPQCLRNKNKDLLLH